MIDLSLIRSKYAKQPNEEILLMIFSPHWRAYPLPSGTGIILSKVNYNAVIREEKIFHSSSVACLPSVSWHSGGAHYLGSENPKKLENFSNRSPEPFI